MGPSSGLTAFVQGKKKTALLKIRQCDNFLAHKIEEGPLHDPEIQEALYKLREKAKTEYSDIVRLLTLIR